jgi:phosphoribosylglycinamide formyltransferase-1
LVNISALVSGGGTNLQAIIDAVSDGRIPGAKMALVISSKPDAYALERARGAGIRTAVVSKAGFPDGESRAAELIRLLEDADTDLVVLAGYMSILQPKITREYAGRIINIHPALLPRHGGEGYYGSRVHRAVLEAGDRESGATVHYVDEGVDSGEIILQGKVPVLDGDTPETLAARVLTVEHRIFVEAINTVIGRLAGKGA